MTLRHLRIFITVCEAGGMTAAGEKLYLSQPSVSQAIRELEEYYGVRLFDRISRKLYLTENGRRFQEYATRIVALFEELETGMRNWDAKGTLRVGASITVGNYLLPDAILRFQESYPQMKVEALISNSETVEGAVLRNDIDLAVIEGNVHSPLLVQRKIMADRLVLLCGPTHPLHGQASVSLEDLPRYDFLLREKGSAGREIFDSIMLLHGIEIRPLWQSASTKAILQGVARGLGLSVLPYRMVQGELQAGLVEEIAIRDISLGRHFSVIYHKNKFLSPAAQEFLKRCTGGRSLEELPA